MDQVMRLMLRNTVTEVYALTRSLHLNRIELAQYHEFKHDNEQAIVLYTQVLKEVQGSLLEIERDIAKEEELKAQREATKSSRDAVEDEEESKEESEYLAALRMRRSLWKELEHRLLFFIASNYHTLAHPNEDDEHDPSETPPVDSKESVDLERKKRMELEDEFYKKAAQVRRQLLGEEEKHVSEMIRHMVQLSDSVADSVSGKDGAGSVSLSTEKYQGGIASHLVFDKLHELQDQLNRQWELLDDWRFRILEHVTKSLEDAEQDEEEGEQRPRGDEYEKGRQNQEEAMLYLVRDF